MYIMCIFNIYEYVKYTSACVRACACMHACVHVQAMSLLVPVWPYLYSLACRSASVFVKVLNKMNSVAYTIE